MLYSEIKSWGLKLGFPKSGSRFVRQSREVCRSDLQGRSEKEEAFSEKCEAGAQD